MMRLQGSNLLKKKGYNYVICGIGATALSTDVATLLVWLILLLPGCTAATGLAF